MVIERAVLVTISLSILVAIAKALMHLHEDIRDLQEANHALGEELVKLKVKASLEQMTVKVHES